ncbi:MAG TPA: uroporphyrinogen decarboxylase [Acidimicrobiales bacterium]|nr:uroporphyrinogen decarboxylase [Acidimicrobiales bacterium]
MTGTLEQAPFLRACRLQPASHRPVWFMRQAGRSLPEYRAIRERASMFEIMRDPALTAEVTLQPVRRLGVDAAILFSDIVAPLDAIGVDVDIKPGVGPVFGRPVRTAADLAQLRPLEPDADMPWVADAVKQLVAELGDIPLIGFAGAPFTVASYLVEGGPSRTYVHTKTLMRTNPALWRTLLDTLADISLASLRAQITAGASAVQVFDSWAGTLSAADYEAYVLPSSKRIFDGLADLGVPRIHFGVGTGELLGLLAAAGADVVGVDWRVPIEVARTRIGPGKAVQGNLDPVLCLAPWEVVEAAARDVLASAGEAPGHIFNLGHGVLPEIDPDTLKRLVDLVHTSG